MKHFVIMFAVILSLQMLLVGCVQTRNTVINDDLVGTDELTSGQTQEEFLDTGEAPVTLPVSLYYYNVAADMAIDESVPCSPDAVLPVERNITVSDTPIMDTLSLLLLGELSQEERDEGFETEFPNPDFQLVSADLDENGVLVLDFTEAPGFTTGGSCRVGLLDAQIRKTAEQFPEVLEVRYTSEELFQP